MNNIKGVLPLLNSTSCRLPFLLLPTLKVLLIKHFNSESDYGFFFSKKRKHILKMTVRFDFNKPATIFVLISLLSFKNR